MNGPNALFPELTVDLGPNQPVVIDKLFGPMVFASLRITPNTQTGIWSIERQRCDSGVWLEVARIPGQLADEFTEVL